MSNINISQQGSVLRFSKQAYHPGDVGFVNYGKETVYLVKAANDTEISMYVSDSIDGSSTYKVLSRALVDQLIAAANTALGDALRGEFAAGDAATLSAANGYTDTKVAALLSQLRNEFAAADAAVLASAQTYANNAAATAQSTAIGQAAIYTDAQIAAVNTAMAAGDAASVTAANGYTDAAVATQAATAAANLNSAINSATSNLQSYADTKASAAQTAAVAAAATYTDTTKADLLAQMASLNAGNGNVVVVADIAARDAAAVNATAPTVFWVADASADASVVSALKVASYLYDPATAAFHMLSEGQPISTSWDALVGKPTSTPQAIDLAVSHDHYHSNSQILDTFANASTAGETLTYFNTLGTPVLIGDESRAMASTAAIQVDYVVQPGETFAYQGSSQLVLVTQQMLDATVSAAFETYDARVSASVAGVSSSVAALSVALPSNMVGTSAW